MTVIHSRFCRTMNVEAFFNAKFSIMYCVRRKRNQVSEWCERDFLLSNILSSIFPEKEMNAFAIKSLIQKSAWLHQPNNASYR